ncbi:hypothetical protein NQ318_001827 [Aromia moschata]|uniref:HTH CENPB-type domain-containing protein n=1 Tax=Aromia moschata TaxID=1265417 RepID=A0AAV8Z120_9CUCU|nr:hypothetical protein NQ318_001827 [Aromia moschata]
MSVSKDHTACRICLNLVDYESSVSLNSESKVGTALKILFHKYFPELDLNITQNPVLCLSCHALLKTYFEFTSICTDNKKDMSLECDTKDENTIENIIKQIELPKILSDNTEELERDAQEFFIRPEEVYVKVENDDSNRDSPEAGMDNSSHPVVPMFQLWEYNQLETCQIETQAHHTTSKVIIMKKSMQRGKRKHVTLRIEQKAAILDKLKRGISGRKLAHEFGVGTSAISDIKRNSAKIERFLKKCYVGPGSRKTLKKAEYPEMEAELYSWFVKQRDNHVRMSYEILAEKGRQLFQKHYGRDTFVASRGWIENFKKRHGLRHLKICPEDLLNKTSTVTPFVRNLSETIRENGLLPTQIYNADGSGLFWKILPDKIVGTGSKLSKEQLTFLACTNSNSTHKLKLLVVGKSKNPREFENASLPVEYTSSPNTRMAPQILKEWFHYSFLRQPIVQNAIRLIKLQYRRSLLAHVLSLMVDQKDDVQKCIKSLTLKDAVCLLHKSWEKVPTMCQEKCWSKIFSGNFDDTVYESEDLSVSLSALHELRQQTRECYDNILDMLTVVCKEKLTDEEMFQWVEETENKYQVNTTEEVPSGSEDEDSESQSVPKISHEDAIKCFSVGLQWAKKTRSN